MRILYWCLNVFHKFSTSPPYHRRTLFALLLFTNETACVIRYPFYSGDQSTPSGVCGRISSRHTGGRSTHVSCTFHSTFGLHLSHAVLASPSTKVIFQEAGCGERVRSFTVNRVRPSVQENSRNRGSHTQSCWHTWAQRDSLAVTSATFSCRLPCGMSVNLGMKTLSPVPVP